MPQPAGDPVAHHRIPDGLAHHKTRPRRFGGIGRVRGQRMDDEAAPACLGPTPHHGTEILTAPQTRGGRQHDVPRRRPDQADSAPRPLRRRAARMARPARVRIRSRNPWTRARRRLFGWKVRLPLLTTYFSCFIGRRERFDPFLACRADARQSVVSPTNVWPRHVERRQRGHAKRPRCIRETLRGYALISRVRQAPPRPRTATAVKSDHRQREGTEWQHAVHREMLAREDALWQRARLVSVPLPDFRRGGTA